MEVYGIDSSRYNDFKDYINVDHRLINKINVNSSNSFDLRKHPYISYNIAQSIVNYRNQHGHYQSLKDLNKLHLIDSLIFRKIAPYLSIGDST
jgi:DNA uptake protein ComE-like DNA-binding protein